jgi:hypothetical protein
LARKTRRRPLGGPNLYRVRLMPARRDHGAGTFPVTVTLVLRKVLPPLFRVPFPAEVRNVAIPAHTPPAASLLTEMAEPGFACLAMTTQRPPRPEAATGFCALRCRDGPMAEANRWCGAALGGVPDPVAGKRRIWAWRRAMSPPENREEGLKRGLSAHRKISAPREGGRGGGAALACRAANWPLAQPSMRASAQRSRRPCSYEI